MFVTMFRSRSDPKINTPWPRYGTHAVAPPGSQTARGHTASRTDGAFFRTIHTQDVTEVHDDIF